MQNFKNKFYSNIWPVLLGFFTAFIIMMSFEYLNSFLFPFPEGFYSNNLEELHGFTSNSHWSIYILVFLGWVVGSFFGSYFLTKTSQKYNLDFSKKYNLLVTKLNKTEFQVFVLALVLTMAAVLNYLMLQTAFLFHMLSLPLFLVCTFLGYKLANRNK